MQVTAQQIFKELEAKKPRPAYLVVGEELFQIEEILTRFKTHFIQEPENAAFHYESFDGEHLDLAALMDSLNTLPGLFAGEGDQRYVLLKHAEKLNASALEALDKYFHSPCESTCFLMVASKVDKRKAWFKAFDSRGGYLEVSDPYERDWPKWHGYMEKKVGKKISLDAWEQLVQLSGQSLSILWTELQKVSLYIGERPQIGGQDVTLLAAGNAGGDVFAFAEEVLSKKSFQALITFQKLLQSAESEIKILSILVRQFRQVEAYLELTKKGTTDPKVVGPQIGVHPFFVSKIAASAKQHTSKTLSRAMELLAEADYRMKIGEGGLFELFLVPYFARG